MTTFRVQAVVAGILLLFVVTVALVWALQPGPPASERFAGVSVSVASQSVVDLPNGRHRLALDVVVTSARAIPSCLGFALDNPFSGRLFDAGTSCPEPVAGTLHASLTLDGFTADDAAFFDHSLLWGSAGGGCGPILGAFGICAIDTAGTVPLSLPRKSAFPQVGPIGSLIPSFSFDPNLFPSTAP